MAAWVGDACGAAQALSMRCTQLRQAEDPVGLGTMRRAGVDETGFGVRDQRGGLFGGGIRQAQEGDVGGVEQAGAFGAVFALVGVDAQHLHVTAGGEVFMDAQAGGAFLTVNEHGMLLSHGNSPFKNLNNEARG